MQPVAGFKDTVCEADKYAFVKQCDPFVTLAGLYMHRVSTEIQSTEAVKKIGCKDY